MKVSFLCYHDNPLRREGSFEIIPALTEGFQKETGKWAIEDGLLTISSECRKDCDRAYLAQVAALLLANDDFKRYRPNRISLGDGEVRYKDGDKAEDLLYRMCPFSTKIWREPSGEWRYSFGPRIDKKIFDYIDMSATDSTEKFEKAVIDARRMRSGSFVEGSMHVEVRKVEGTNEIFVMLYDSDLKEAICIAHGILNSKLYPKNMNEFKKLCLDINRSTIHIMWKEVYEGDRVSIPSGEIAFKKGSTVTSVLRALANGDFKRYRPNRNSLGDGEVRYKDGDKAEDLLYRMCPFSTKIWREPSGEWRYSFGPRIDKKIFEYIDMSAADSTEKFEKAVIDARRMPSGSFVEGSMHVEVRKVEGTNEIFVMPYDSDPKEAICIAYGILNSELYSKNMNEFKKLCPDINRSTIHIMWQEVYEGDCVSIPSGEIAFKKGSTVTSILRAFCFGDW